MECLLRLIGVASLIALACLCVSPVGAAPGDLDPTFGVNGTAIPDFGPDYGPFYPGAQTVAIQSDGKIVVAGHVSDVNTDKSALAVARFEVDGSLDMTFGPGGLSVPDIDLGEGGAAGIIIAPDGKIIVSGVVAGISGGEFPNPQQKFLIARFDAAGALDSSFGTSGITVTDFAAGMDGGGESLVRLSDGTLVVCGVRYSPDAHGVLIAYDDAGQLDPNFGDGGSVVTEDPARFFDLAASNDTLFATGYAGEELALARFELDGTLIAVTHVPAQAGSWRGRSIALDQNTRPVVAGAAGDDSVVVRFLPDGTLDHHFGDDGVVIANVDSSGPDEAISVAQQPDGRILFGTFFFLYGPPSGLPTEATTLLRLDPDGTLDETFAGDGSTVTADGYPASIAVQQDGRVVMAGSIETVHGTDPNYYYETSWLLRRYEATVAIACDAAPRSGCATGASILKLTHDDVKPPALRWKWKKGSATEEQLGLPPTSGSFTWCLYDASDALVGAAQVEAGTACDSHGEQCWMSKGSSWQYTNPRGTVWGIDRIKLKPAVDGAQIQLQGKHWNLPNIALPATLPLRAQMLSPSGDCFEAAYSVAKTNDATQLNAKSN